MKRWIAWALAACLCLLFTPFGAEGAWAEDRIVLTIATETAAIDERNVTREERADIFSLTGLRTDGQPRAGIYVVNRNGRPTKMVVK